jgi:hypothetical protein
LEKIFEEILIPAINSRRKLLNMENAPALIICDGHTSRKSEKIFGLCVLENIDFLCLPSHLSNVLQPLDKNVNAVFRNVVRFKKINSSINSEKENREAFVNVMLNAASSALSYSTIKSSWELVGLNPFNPYKVLLNEPIIPPKFLRKKSSKLINNSISGKVLVFSSFNYSLRNLHLRYFEKIKAEIKSSVNINEDMYSALKLKLKTNKNAEILTEKIEHLKNIIEKEKKTLMKIELNEKIYNIDGLNNNNNNTDIENTENFNSIMNYKKCMDSLDPLFCSCFFVIIFVCLFEFFILCFYFD